MILTITLTLLIVAYVISAKFPYGFCFHDWMVVDCYTRYCKKCGAHNFDNSFRNN